MNTSLASSSPRGDGRPSAAAPAPARARGGVAPGGRSRWSVASRALAALAGGYLLAAVSTVALALATDAPAEAYHAALPGFVLHVGAAVWAFAAPSATRAWAGILLPTLVCALLALFFL